MVTNGFEAELLIASVLRLPAWVQQVLLRRHKEAPPERRAGAGDLGRGSAGRDSEGQTR